MCPPSDLASTAARDADGKTDNFPFEAILDTPISKSAYAHAADILHPSILNHSIRVFKYADEIAKHTSSKYFTDPHQRDLLFTACILHDIGTTQEYNGPQRFEVEGADAAVKHLSRFAVSEADAHSVWTAIACHTSPGIGERIGELSRIVRIAVITDFRRDTTEWKMLEPIRERLEAQHERAEIEKVLGDAVVEQAKVDPRKAPKVSWPHAMYTAWLAEPGWNGVNKAF
jgi:HD superfamily phosphohydrolase YqeK